MRLMIWWRLSEETVDPGMGSSFKVTIRSFPEILEAVIIIPNNTTAYHSQNGVEQARLRK